MHEHHTGADVGVFALLAAEFPELRPVIAELQRDHRQVFEILRWLREAAGRERRSCRRVGLG